MNSINIRSAFEGFDLQYRTAESKLVTRVYMDSAASTLALKPSQDVVREFLQYYSNTHSSTHLGAKVSTEVVRWAERRIRSFVGADDSYITVFMGSGSTLPLNRIAEGLAQARPTKTVVLASIMEHHSNDLPHRMHNQFVEYIPVLDEHGNFLGIQLENVRQLLEKHKGKVNYIAITGASNVSGHLTPIHDIAALAHAYDALIVVDGAQLVAHSPVCMCPPERDQAIDFFVFSGHKVYAPGSPGVLIGRKEIMLQMSPAFYGGGMVKSVSSFDFDVATDLFDKEHAGTLNVSGILAIATAVDFLAHVGMDKILAEEKILVQCLLDGLKTIPGMNIYPEGEFGERIGVVSFNIAGIPHELLSLMLNDFFGVAVRNDCFCAHPFVRECLSPMLWDINESEVALYRGMVRISLGLYSTQADVDYVINALQTIVGNISFYRSQYEIQSVHNFVHKSFAERVEDYFDVNARVAKSFSTYLY